MKSYQDLLNDICKKHHIKIETVSNNWINILERNNKIRFIVGYTFGLNTDTTAQILNDKYALYSVLKYNNIPIIEHNLLYKNYDRKQVSELFLKYNQNVVIKANNSSMGKDVFHISNIEDLYQKMDELFLKNYSLSLCPYLDITREYRLIVLDNELKLVYGKEKPIVVGDGVNTYKELLKEFNPNYDYNITEDYVLKKGEVKEYNWQFNLSKGAMPFLVTDQDLITKLWNIALLAINKVNIRFASIDIIAVGNTYQILEINNGVCMSKFMNVNNDYYKKAYLIYEEALLKLFN